MSRSSVKFSNIEKPRVIILLSPKEFLTLDHLPEHTISAILHNPFVCLLWLIRKSFMYNQYRLLFKSTNFSSTL